MLKLLGWLDARLPFVSTWRKYASEYYVPKNLNIYYCFGALAIVVLINQLLSGLWLTMFYIPTVAAAFDSIQTIMRDINYGWLFRYLHTTGASAFFIVLYIHIFRGLLYGSYQQPRELVWLLGMGLFILLLAEAFFGYLLPWGQLSYWGAEVITSLVEAIPMVGGKLALWFRGDYSVGQATLQRFFALHIILIPLLVLGGVFLHIVALHKVGSNNPQGIDILKHQDTQGRPVDGVPFHPFYTLKDLIAILVFLGVFFTIVFYFPSMHGYFLEATNSIPANALITPEKITPMWYLAPFYAMLRAVPAKLGGVMCVASAILIWLFLPWLDKSPVRALRYKGSYSKYALICLVMSFCLLGYLGLKDITPGRLIIARVFSVVYFGYFILMPWYTTRETCVAVPERLK